MTLPRIGNSMEINSVSERDTKHRRATNMGSKSVDQPRMATIPIIESVGSEENNLVKMNTSLRESAEQTASFDTKKWKRIINGNVDMI